MKKKINSIAILICWSGSYPWYFPYFIHSCKYNIDIDFYIITDNKETILNKPSNVKIIDKSLEEIREEASKKLGFKVNIDYPYKLCDFKPAYGFIFSELIKGYDFWGQSDIDIIYGNIRDFLTDELLNTYDFISMRHDYTTGCFALYKNNDLMNNFFKRSKDFKTVFTSPDHYCFDECNFVWDDLTMGKSIFELKTNIESFTHLIKSAEISGEIKPHFDFILLEGLTGQITFDNGRIYYKNKYEGIMYHLFWFKKFYKPKKIIKKIPDKYFISKAKIYHSRKSN
ncbi:DUF6625 family protein [Flavobacterium sp. 1355]|uniref:DUF6625 family protein n=1 Tax=Flavobacterium sp. 1355 TaxID=2806571 RepID=UPI001B4AEF59|nr:DUF6625 family protein [Flavobacterium sp. 1355]MBP1225089.1 hypothetical protein [Flavobacterium sp. 1355]